MPRTDRQRPRRLASLIAAVYERVDRAAFGPVPDALDTIEGWTGHDDEVVDAEGADAGNTAGPFDVILNLTSGHVEPPAGSTPRFGVWAFDHGDGRRTRTGAPAFLGELIERRNGITTTLRRVDAGAGDARLFSSYGAISRRSLARSRNENLWKAAAFPRRVLEGLAAGRKHATSTLPDTDPDARASSSTRLARFVATQAMVEAPQFLRDRRTKLQWRIGVRPKSQGLPDPVTERPFHAIRPPHDRYYADPFLLTRDDRTFLFFEDADFATEHGVIRFVELADDGQIATPPVTVLKAPHHLSYPCVWSEGDDVFITAESASARIVEILRATEFPFRWEPVCRVLEGVHAYDPTVLRIGGTYWLWATIAVEGANPNDELFVYFADSLEGPWEPHPRNPVVSDARRARPAGRPFALDDRLVRPAQVCVPSYGADVVLRKVELDRTSYRETDIAELGWGQAVGGIGCHTYNRGERLETFDTLHPLRPRRRSRARGRR